MAIQPGDKSVSPIDEEGSPSTVVFNDRDGCQIIVAGHNDVTHLTQAMGPAV